MNVGWQRIKALTIKEFREVLRDNSSLAMGILLPIALLFIIGYGISLDVKNVSLGVVLEDTSPQAQQVVNFVDGTEYFRPVYMTDMYQAEERMEKREIDAILRVPPDFPGSCSREMDGCSCFYTGRKRRLL